MQLAEYFEKAKGIGILSTADSSGKVNTAVYGRPHVIDEKTIAFIAADRLTHANLQSNPSAAYLFKEDGSFAGKRLYLTKSREEQDSPLIDEIRRRKSSHSEEKVKTESKYLIYFTVNHILPLIGDGV